MKETGPNSPILLLEFYLKVKKRICLDSSTFPFTPNIHNSTFSLLSQPLPISHTIEHVLTFQEPNTKGFEIYSLNFQDNNKFCFPIFCHCIKPKLIKATFISFLQASHTILLKGISSFQRRIMLYIITPLNKHMAEL